MQQAGATTYTVRRATDDDLIGVVQLHHKHATPEHPAPPEATELQQRTWAQMMATGNLNIAECDGEIVGNTCMTIVANPINDCRPTAFVEPMLVAAAHRRRGVGRHMVDQLLADADTAGVYKIQLLSHKRHAQDGAHAFYLSLGFTPEAEGFRLYRTDD